MMNQKTPKCILPRKTLWDSFAKYLSNAIIVSLFITVGASDLFALESITVASPNGDEAWAVGTSHTISWTSTGTVDYVAIYYSPDNFQAVTNTINAWVANTGSYEWVIPNDISPDLRFKVKVVAASYPDAYDVSNLPFKIKSNIQVTAPAGGDRWVTNEDHNITWQWTGTVPQVTIQYSKDNFTTDINTIVAATANTGSYNWTIPNDKSETVRVRVWDSRDLTSSGQSPAPFKIDYYYITFVVLDDITRGHLSALSFKDMGTGTIEFPVSSPKTKGFPYGVYSTVIYKTGYIECGLDLWIADSDKMFTVKLESSVVHNWQVMADFNYDPVGDDLHVTSWFMRDGLLMPDPEKVVIEIYDETGTFIKKLESNAPREDGVFNIDWLDTGLESNITYWAKIGLTYAGKTFTSASTLEIELGGVQSNLTTYFNFNTIAGRLETTAWLMLDGIMITNPDSITINIHDQAGVTTKTLSSSSHDSSGIFQINWVNPTVYPGQTYLAEVTIAYAGKAFTSASTLKMESGDSSYQVLSYFNFNIPANRLETTSWLMLDGLMVPNPESITIDIHDQAGVLIKTLSASAVDSENIFRINWDNPTLDSQQTYLAYVTIFYLGKYAKSIIAYKLGVEPQTTGSSGVAFTDSGSHGSRCGLMGIEFVLLIGVMLFLKRKRA
ncbi:MAG: hypothetical protein V1701_05590 [Planctomycetota bacterium]